MTSYRRGFVERHEDTEDRRMKRVSLTDPGRAVIRRLNAARLSGLEQFTETLTEAERRKLAGALSKLLEREDVCGDADRKDIDAHDTPDPRPPTSPRDRREQPLVDARRDVLRAVHGDARQHRRERFAAVDPARPARLAVGARVDDQRVHAELRRAACHRRPARRHLRAAQDVHVRRDRVRALERGDRVRRRTTRCSSRFARSRGSAPRS